MDDEHLILGLIGVVVALFGGVMVVLIFGNDGREKTD